MLVILSVPYAPPVRALEALRFDAPGAGDDLTETLRNTSLLVAAEAEGVDNPQELLAAARADYGRLIGALYNQGHFGGVINIRIDGREAAGIPPLARIGAIRDISITVTPGPEYRFSRTEIAPLAPGTELPEEFAVGEPARSPVIVDAAGAAVEGWRETGRAKADVAAQEVIARHERAALDVQIAMAPGPVVRFGELILQGGESVRPERLRAIAGLPVGDVFSPGELEDAAQRLRRTGVFSSVSLTEAERLGPGNTMDITATLAEQPPRRLGFGAEISSIEGLTLSGFWLHRNLLGGAERLRIEGEVAGIGGGTGGMDYSLGFRFGRPATFTPDTDFYVAGEIEHLEEPDFTSDTASLGFGLTRIITDTLEVEAGLAYRYSQIEDDSGEFEYGLLTLPLRAVYDNRDDPLNATEGYFADVTLTPFLGFNDADNGARLTFDARTYYGFGADDRVVLAGRIQGGSILGAELTGVPNDYRFYSGGGGTVRGQEYQSLGVELDDGTDSGGRSYLGLSAEIRGRVTESIGLVGFVDYGLVGEDSFPGSDAEDHAGAGLGLRYLTPIGPIRFDVAAPIGGESSGAEVYIGIGQAF